MNGFPGFEDLAGGRERIAVIGLGYVGLPLAILLAGRFRPSASTVTPPGWQN